MFIQLLVVICYGPLLSDSLRFTSALSVALAVVFVVITAGITIVKLINGSIPVPRWVPHITDAASIWNLFTVVPVLVTAFICHYNGELRSPLKQPGYVWIISCHFVCLSDVS